MDDMRFDAWVRSLKATASSRRDMFRRVLVGGGLTLALALFDTSGASAGRGDGKKCKRGSQCDSGRCTGKKGHKRCRSRPQPPPRCDGDEDCPAGRSCCDFPEGSECVDLLNDTVRCGSCDANCPLEIAGGSCLHGGCTNLCDDDDECFSPCQCFVVAFNGVTEVCGNPAGRCDSPTTCTDDDDCDAGEGCFLNGCPGVSGGVCLGSVCGP